MITWSRDWMYNETRGANNSPKAEIKNQLKQTLRLI